MSELAWLNKGWAGCEPIWVKGNKSEGEIALDNRYKPVGLVTNELDLI